MQLQRYRGDVDPLVAFVMAALALLVSLGGLTISLLTYLRGRAPRPKWVTKVSIQADEDGERTISATATNRGRGEAHDAVLVYDNLEPLLAAFARDHADRAPFGKTLRSGRVVDRNAFGDGAFRLTWAEEPNLHRTRVKMLKFHLDPAATATSRRARRNR